MLCPNCGADLGNRQVKFCPYCGKSVLQTVPQQKSAPAPKTNPVPPPKQNPVPGTEPVTDSKSRPVANPRPSPVADPRMKPSPVRTVKPAVPVEPVKQEKPLKPAKENSGGKNRKVLLITVLVVAVLAVVAVGVFFGIRWIQGFSVKLPGLVENVLDIDAERSLDDEDTQNITKPDTLEQTEPAQETEETPTQSAQVLMPNLTGMDYGAAVQILSNMGCTVTFEYEFSDTVEMDCVLTQSLAPDQPLTEGRNIVLWVSQGPDTAPEGYDQKVVVTAGSGSSYGTLTFYTWENGGWVSKFSCDATVGKNGISTNYGEGKGRTPEGVFKLGVALSANSIPNSSWPFFQVSSSTCVVDDVDSVYYNTIQNKNNLPSGTSYDPIGNTIVKGYSTACVYIEHNGNGIDSENVVPGLGSVITLCGRTGSLKPTAGCVDISSSNMNTLLGLLDYGKNPHIEIYVE